MMTWFDALSLEDFIRTYGYWAVLAGCLLEGETILFLGGIAAQEGYLSLPLVILVAFAGGFAGDQILFFVGRFYGDRVLNRYPNFAAQAERPRALLLRYGNTLIVIFRFLYGMRLMGAIIFGASGISPVRFLIFNALGAFLWANLVAGAGYLLGRALSAMVGDLREIETYLFGGIVLVLVAFLAFRWVRSRRVSDQGNRVKVKMES
ncbi:MAG: DedA family protein [Alphaproteobacteria bacterium]